MDAPVTRRTLLKAGLGLAATQVPAFGMVTTASQSQNVLILVHLRGGNDGYNTLVPYTSDEYYRARPTIAIPARQVLKISDRLGFHPAMEGMYRLFKDGKLGIFENVSYPNPSRSHWRASEIWRTGEPEAVVETAWYEGFAQGRVHNYQCGVNDFVETIEFVKKNIASAKVHHITFDGFDTHLDQSDAHAKLLEQVSSGLEQFADANVPLLVYSEFGRTLAQNHSAGTDHGGANSAFVMGLPIRGHATKELHELIAILG